MMMKRNSIKTDNLFLKFMQEMDFRWIVQVLWMFHCFNGNDNNNDNFPECKSEPHTHA